MTGNVRQTPPEPTCGTLWVTCDNSPTCDGTGPQNGPEGTVDMNSIDNLREYVLTAPSICSTTRAILVGYIDGIEREVEANHIAVYNAGYDEGFASADDWVAQHEDAMAEHGWVRLPVSEDGDVLHIGELVDEKLPFGGYAAPAPIDTMELSRGAGGYGWMVRLDSESGAFINPKLLCHHRAPTVEDVLEEFVARWMETHHDDIPALKAEYAARLMLAEGVDK